MNMKNQNWVIEITLTRTFYGTRRQAEDIADEDFKYYESQVDGDQFVNVPSPPVIFENNPIPFPSQIQKTVEDMEWEEDIVRFCGWSMERVQEEIHEIGIETGWHEDDDRQDILESLVGKILDDAKEYLLPKYYEQWKLSQA